MITIPSGFNITTAEAVDARIVLSKQGMCDIADAKMPDKYFAICSDNGKLYLYNKSNTVSAETGKFREYSGGGEPEAYLKSAAVNGNKLTLTKKDDSTVVFEPQTGATYTAGDNIQISAQNVISATDTINVFWCTYNQTTYAEITQALADNKVPMMMLDGAILKFTYKLTDNSYTFSTVFSYGGSYIVGTRCETNNTWSSVMTLLENTEHMDQSLSSSSASDHYPSSACVYNAVSAKQDKLTAGTNITIDANNVISATGGGATYTAGTNINITDNAISVSVDDIELTGTSGTFNDEQMAKLSNSTLTCLILNNKRFKLQYTAVGRSGIVAMYASVLDSVSEIIEVDVTGKAWAHAETALQSVLTAGDNVSIINNVVSAIDTKLATSITLGKQITAGQAVGGIAAGKVYAATDTLAQVIEDLLSGSGPAPTGTKLYYSIGATVPTDVTGMTSVSTDAETLKYSGYTWKNVALDNEYAFLAIDKTLGVECYEILQNGFALGFNTVDLGDQILYYPDTKGKDTGIRLVYHFE